METAKGNFTYKFEQFHVSITPFSDKKLAIDVIDTINKMQFKESMLTLEQIGSATLMKAFDKSAIQIKLAMKVNST